MNPEELEQLLIARLNALPTEENRLLYDIDYDEGLVIETARNLLAHNPFPLSPRLNAHRLTILAAFASAMAETNTLNWIVSTIASRTSSLQMCRLM